MSVQAVGIYLDAIIRGQELKLKTVAQRAGVQYTYVSRLISGDIKEPGAGTLRRVTLAANGSWEDVGQLLADSANDEDARRLARGLLAVIHSGDDARQREAERLRRLADQILSGQADLQ